MSNWTSPWCQNVAIRLGAVFLATSLLPTLGAVSLFYWLERQETVHLTYDRLGRTADLKVQILTEWLNICEQRLIHAADELAPFVVLPRDGRPDEPLGTPEFLGRARRVLRRLHSFAPAFLALGVIDRQGRIVLSTDPLEEGKSMAGREFFHQGLNGTHPQSVRHSLATGCSLLTITAPLATDGRTASGVLAGDLAPQAVQRLIGLDEGRSESGVTLLVNRFNYLAAPVLADLGEHARSGVYTWAVENALAGRNGQGSYPGTAGRTVYGVYRWLPHPGLALVVEIDRAEALSGLHRLMAQVGVAALVALLLASILFSWALSRSIRPLDELSAAAEVMSTGNLGVRVGEGRPDQIGRLARNLNRLAANLQWTLGELRDSEQKYRALVDLAPEGIALVDSQDRVLEANPAFCRIYGIPLAQVLAMKPSQFYFDPARDRDRALEALAREGRVDGLEIEGRRLDGTSFRALLSVCEIELAGQRVKEVMLRDLSQQRGLEDRVFTQERQLRQLNRELQGLNAELSGMVSILSHDLKSPLISLRGYSEVLAQEWGGQLNPGGLHALRRIQVNSAMLEQMIEGLIQYVNTGRVPEEGAEVQLADLIRMSLRRHEAGIGRRTIRIEIEDDLGPLRVPRTALQLALDHLIENAIKFMGNRPDPRIRILGRREGACLRVAVEDNGIGIDPRLHEEIFDLFRRLDEVRESEGTGAGLAVLRRVLRRLGGEILVASEPGRGSTFTVILPLGTD